MPTEIWSSRLREEEKKEKEKKEEAEATLIKSREPRPAGGEKTWSTRMVHSESEPAHGGKPPSRTEELATCKTITIGIESIDNSTIKTRA